MSIDLFHKSFLDILRETDPLYIEYQKIRDTNPEFLQVNLQVLPKTSASVVAIAPLLLQKVKRSQTLLESSQ
jgi:hypothetical protein